MTEHDDSSGLFSTGRRALTLGLFLAVTMNGFEALGVSAAMPRVADELRGGRLYGLAFGVFMLGQVASIPIAGAEADRRGSRRPFALGLLVFAIGLSLAAAAPSMLIFVGARALSGLGAGAITAVNLAAIGRAYPEHLRSKMFAVVSTAWVLPGAIGPGVSGWVADHASWRWVFAGLLPLIPVVAALVLPTLGRVVGAEAESPSSSANVTATALRLALATASIVGGISVGWDQDDRIQLLGNEVLHLAQLRGDIFL